MSVYFSTAVLIGDTVNKEPNVVNEQKLVKKKKKIVYTWYITIKPKSNGIPGLYRGEW